MKMARHIANLLDSIREESSGFNDDTKKNISDELEKYGKYGLEMNLISGKQGIAGKSTSS